MQKVYEMNNNERAVVGVFENADGTYTAITFSKSKDFKTLAGAIRWIKKFGF